MTSEDDRIAAELAEQAGQRLLDLRAGGGSPDDLRKAGDQLSHDFLAAELAARCPGDAVLSEEGRDDPVRLSAKRVWIVDPLDGTREFGEAGRTDWAVHVALWERGSLTAGAVALPAQGQVLSTAEPPKVPATAPGGLLLTRGDDPPEPPEGLSGRGLRVVVSRTRPPAFLERLSELTGVILVPWGSAGAKAAAVMQGKADAYIHAGGQYEWDSAAPVAVAQAAGLHASRIDGSALEYNQPDPVLPDILICPTVLARPFLDAIGQARAAQTE
jgi:3'(2'), 5'-bisphosphate nucleotidase